MFPISAFPTETILESVRPKLHQLQDLTIVSYGRLFDLFGEWLLDSGETLVRDASDIFGLWLQYAFDNWAFGISRRTWVDACLTMGVEIVR